MNRTLITVNGRYKGDCSCGYMSLAIEAGRSRERAAIVAWLRNCDGFTRFTVAGAEGSSIAMWDKNDYADAVEHGAHLAGDDE